jgi:hypothetical protein
MIMGNKAKKLLMMFIKDGYESSTGKISKKTALAMMNYVRSDGELQRLVNNSDWRGLINHNLTNHPED